MSLHTLAVDVPGTSNEYAEFGLAVRKEDREHKRCLTSREDLLQITQFPIRSKANCPIGIGSS